MSSAKFLTLTSRLLKKIERSSYGFLVIFIRITEEYLCKRAWRAFAVNESIRKSQSINFAPMQGGCPLCGK